MLQPRALVRAGGLMFIRIVASISSVIVLNFGLVSVGICQTTAVEEMTPEAEKTPDEIIVYGEKSIIILQNELYRAEESFFDLFNTLNSDDEFDVECKKRAFIGERRRIHQCMPAFAEKYAAQAISGFQFDGNGYPLIVNVEYRARVKKKEEMMWAEMAELVKKNPEFLREVIRLQKANQALESERTERGSCPKIFCRD